MTIRKTLTALAASSLVLGSAASAATPAPRTASAVEQKEEVAGFGTFGIILGVVVAAAAIAIIADDGGDPESP